MKNINTVNVIEENIDTGIISGTSFLDNDEGNQEAQELFSKIALENGANDKDLEDYLDDGIFELGGYRVTIAHF